MAALAGRRDGDDLMRALAGVSRRAAWLSHDVWAILGGRSRTVRIPSVADGSAVLAAASEAVRTGGRLDRSELGSVRRAPLPTWTATDLAAWNGLAPRGRARPVFEALGHAGIRERSCPSGPTSATVRRRRVHRFTVDRHLLETVAKRLAARRPLGDPSYDAARACRRPHVLLMAALLHDIGKAGPRPLREGGAMAFDGRPAWLLRADAMPSVAGAQPPAPVEVATRLDLDDPASWRRRRPAAHERLRPSTSSPRRRARHRPAPGARPGPGWCASVWWRADLLPGASRRPTGSIRSRSTPTSWRPGRPAVRGAARRRPTGTAAPSWRGTAPVPPADVAGALTLAGLDVVEATAAAIPRLGAGCLPGAATASVAWARIGAGPGHRRRGWPSRPEACRPRTTCDGCGSVTAAAGRGRRGRRGRRRRAQGQDRPAASARPPCRGAGHDGPGLLAAVASVFAADGLDARWPRPTPSATMRSTSSTSATATAARCRIHYGSVRWPALAAAAR